MCRKKTCENFRHNEYGDLELKLNEQQLLNVLFGPRVKGQPGNASGGKGHSPPPPLKLHSLIFRKILLIVGQFQKDDFDMTLTKYWVDGNRGQSKVFHLWTCTHALLQQGNADYDLKREQLFDYYHPLEVCPTIPIDEKTKLMEECPFFPVLLAITFLNSYYYETYGHHFQPPILARLHIMLLVTGTSNGLMNMVANTNNRDLLLNHLIASSHLSDQDSSPCDYPSSVLCSTQQENYGRPSDPSKCDVPAVHNSNLAVPSKPLNMLYNPSMVLPGFSDKSLRQTASLDGHRTSLTEAICPQCINQEENRSISSEKPNDISSRHPKE
eukprot:Gb_30866 [translate_table: standard]